MIISHICVWVGLFATAYWGMSGYIATLFVLTFTIVCHVFDLLSPLGLGVYYVLSLSLAGVGIAALRRLWLSRCLLSWFKKVLPPISATEQDAIEAGDVWWEGDLFRGQPDWNKLRSLPTITLTRAEQDFLDQQTEQLCHMLDDWQINHQKLDLPKEVWTFLRTEKFFSMMIPKEYGGLAFSATANSTIVHKIASRSLTAAVTVMVPNSLGPGELLEKYGTLEQKETHLPRLANGQDIPCFALTGIEAGSDAGAIPDKGVVCQGRFEGKDVIGLRLTWRKRYITLAPIATLIGLAIKVFDPDKLLSDKVERGITLCLLPRKTAGIEIGRRHFPLNQAFMNGPISGTDVFIPLDWIIGGPDKIGCGWRMLVECLSAGRGISLPALSTAAGKVAYLTTGAYARVREQFGTALAHFDGIVEAMAQIAGSAYYLEATRLFTTSALDSGQSPSVVTAIAKYHMTELSRSAIEHAMDVHGGKGIMLGPRNYLGRSYQGMPIGITVEGANILTRNLMIFGQGAIRCHPYVRQEMAAAATNDTVVFDRILFTHIGSTIRHICRLCVRAALGPFIRKKSGTLRYYEQQLSQMSLALAVISDITLLVLGGKLKRLERLSARLGDVLSHLYLASSVIKYYHDHQSADHLPYLHWCLQNSLYEIGQALTEFCDNFHPKWLGGLLKHKIFPYGCPYKKPSDALDKELVTLMTTPGGVRATLTQHIFTGEGPLADLEKILLLRENVAKLLKSLHTNHKGRLPKGLSLTEKITYAREHHLLTPAELNTLTEYDELRLRCIMVDDFSDRELA